MADWLTLSQRRGSRSRRSYEGDHSLFRMTNMKRMQLFEFEDFNWFPRSIRDNLTRMLSLLHRWLGSTSKIAEILSELVRVSGRHCIVDLCSGDGDLMIEVQKRLHQIEGMQAVKLELTDLYPNRVTRSRIALQGFQLLSYRDEPLDATAYRDTTNTAIRTLVSGFHHMNPEQAKAILSAAMAAGDPILIYEISDNSFPPKYLKYLWWIALPLNLVFGFFVAAIVRPMTFHHFFFSFILPIIPFCFAWDGAVSNIRTYTESDLQELLSDLQSEDYKWSIRKIDAKPSKHLCLVGMPS